MTETPPPSAPRETAPATGDATASPWGASSVTFTLDHDPFADLEAAPGPQDCIPYEEAQRLMAIARTHGDSALTPAQHNAIWDCLLAQPASHEWLAAQVAALQAEARAQVQQTPLDPDSATEVDGAGSAP